MAVDWLLFWIFAPISVASAFLMVLQRNAVHSALFLVVNFFTIAVFYLVLGSPFLFVVQIVVYAGAIMVLFLFVIMLLGVDRRESLTERIRGHRPISILLGVGVLAEIAAAVHAGVGLSAKTPHGFDTAVNAGGNPQALARVLFTSYFFPFEVTSVLLIVAAIAAMVLAHRKLGAPPAAFADGADAAAEPEKEPVS